MYATIIHMDGSQKARTDQDSPNTQPQREAPGQSYLSWRAKETSASRKSGDWYFLLWTAALAGSAIAVILDNILFAALIILAAFTLSVTVSKRPREIEFEITRRGVVAGTLFLPFSSLSSFCILELESGGALLLLESSKALGRRHVFPISEEVDPNNVRDFLLEHLKEEDLEVPFSDRVADSLGV